MLYARTRSRRPVWDWIRQADSLVAPGMFISKFGKKFPAIYRRGFGTIALGFRRSRGWGRITNHV